MSDISTLGRGIFIKFDDFSFLDKKQQIKLEKVITFIARKKQALGMPDEKYIIINSRAPYANKVMGIILAEEERAMNELAVMEEGNDSETTES